MYQQRLFAGLDCIQDAYEVTDQGLREDWSMTEKKGFPTDGPALVAKANSYYDIGGIETIDFIKAKLSKEEYKGYLLGNIMKYSSRLDHKGNARADVKKLQDYTNWLAHHILEN